MAKATDGITTDQMLLGAAMALFVKAWGSPPKAEKELRRAFVATEPKVDWGYREKDGKASDREFWRRASFKLEENSAQVRFLAPKGTGSADYYVVWVSRAHVLASLGAIDEEADGRRSSKEWITAEAKDMKKAGKIPATITKFAKELARRMATAAEADHSIHPIGWPSIKNRLAEWGLWPPDLIK
jgi:hypothetical protein